MLKANLIHWLNGDTYHVALVSGCIEWTPKWMYSLDIWELLSEIFLGIKIILIPDMKDIE